LIFSGTSKRGDSVKNSRVLITGGAGLVGSHIADQVARLNPSEIIILDNFVRGSRRNLSWALENAPVKIIEGDIRDHELVNRVMDGIDIVFEQAALRITQCAAEPRLAIEVMANGAFNVVDAAAKAGVKRIVSASSASIYGLAERFPTAESHPPYHNRTLYGALKIFYEGLLRSFHDMHGLNYVALRYFNVYGPRMDIHGVYTEVLIRWMDRIRQGLPPVIFGDGSQTMDFVYIEDIARANILAAQSDITDEVFNVASGVEVSLNELADTLLKAMDSRLQVEYGPERKVNPVNRRLADVDKARRMLGFETSVKLEDGLRRLVDWWQVQPAQP
jgi:UDP-glucose 4-epimerase